MAAIIVFAHTQLYYAHATCNWFFIYCIDVCWTPFLSSQVAVYVWDIYSSWLCRFDETISEKALIRGQFWLLQMWWPTQVFGKTFPDVQYKPDEQQQYYLLLAICQVLLTSQLFTTAVKQKLGAVVIYGPKWLNTWCEDWYSNIEMHKYFVMAQQNSVSCN